MDLILYFPARWLVQLLQALPLTTVARIGRVCGRLAFVLDRRHRRMAVDNMARALGEAGGAEAIRRLACENFCRIGESFACAVKTAGMGPEEVSEVLEVVGAERLSGGGAGAGGRVVAIGHFGNFELYAKAGQFAPGYRFATTYRALRHPSLNRLMQSLREKSGCLFFERRMDGDRLKAAMHEGGVMIGFLSDQHGGRKGVWGPFLGRECSTTPAPAVFALRYRCPLVTAFCYRVAPGKWRIEVGQEIPTQEGGRARSVEAITGDINRAFEVAVLRDPANWFWVHNRWKPRKRDMAGANALGEDGF